MLAPQPLACSSSGVMTSGQRVQISRTALRPTARLGRRRAAQVRRGPVGTTLSPLCMKHSWRPPVTTSGRALSCTNWSTSWRSTGASASGGTCSWQACPGRAGVQRQYGSAAPHAVRVSWGQGPRNNGRHGAACSHLAPAPAPPARASRRADLAQCISVSVGKGRNSEPCGLAQPPTGGRSHIKKNCREGNGGREMETRHIHIHTCIWPSPGGMGRS